MKKILLLFDNVELNQSISLSTFISTSYQQIRQDLKEIHLEFTGNIKIEIEFYEEIDKGTDKFEIYTTFTLYSKGGKRLKIDNTSYISRLFSLNTKEEFEKLKDDYPLLVR
mmetsp:Transcript_26475/g.23420  ORF Transcript_26475/g.23420 Transcript_26475/m.23420 type:complete len:111 (-) Transcript_26475:62-394(-)